MKTAVNGAIILFIGLVFGGLSAQVMVHSSYGQSTIKAGVWTASAFVGGLEVDPYTAARIAIEGSIPLGGAEGLAFEADRDDQGRQLVRECSYKLKGITPSARFWTLTAHSAKGQLLKSRGGDVSSLLSYHALREPDFNLEVIVSNRPTSGNWLHVEGKGALKLIMRLYDTSITSSARGAALPMPSIERMDCAS